MTSTDDPDDRPIPSGPTWRPAGYGDPSLDGEGVRLQWVGKNVARLSIDERKAMAIIYAFVLVVVGFLVLTVRQLGIGWVTHGASAITVVALLAMLVLRPPWKHTVVIEIDKRRQCIRRSTGWNRRPSVSVLGSFERLTVHPFPMEGRVLFSALRLTGADGARQLLVGPSSTVEEYGAKLARWLGLPLRYSRVVASPFAIYNVPRSIE